MRGAWRPLLTAPDAIRTPGQHCAPGLL